MISHVTWGRVRQSGNVWPAEFLKNQILLLRYKKKIVFQTVNFCFYIILPVFHFDYFWVNFGRKSKARFIRRTLHGPKLIIWFGACKDRRMNQLGSTDLYLGRPAVLFDCASRIERQKCDFDSYVELVHVPNQIHTLRINYINYIYPRDLRVPSTWHAQRTSFWTRWRDWE